MIYWFLILNDVIIFLSADFLKRANIPVKVPGEKIILISFTSLNPKKGTALIKCNEVYILRLYLSF
jgi:hypothetical protein